MLYACRAVVFFAEVVRLENLIQVRWRLLSSRLLSLWLLLLRVTGGRVRLLGVVIGRVVDRHCEEVHHAARVAVLSLSHAGALEVVVDLEVVEDAIVEALVMPVELRGRFRADGHSLARLGHVVRRRWIPRVVLVLLLSLGGCWHQRLSPGRRCLRVSLSRAGDLPHLHLVVRWLRRRRDRDRRL